MKFNRKKIGSALLAILLAIFVGVGIANQPEPLQNADDTSSDLVNSTVESTNEEEQSKEDRVELATSETTSQSDKSSNSSSQDKEETKDTEGQSGQKETTHTQLDEENTSQEKKQSKKTTQSSQTKQADKHDEREQTTKSQKSKKESHVSKNTSSHEKTETVAVRVDFSDIGKGSLSLTANYQEGMTAMDATTEALRAQALNYNVRGAGATAYMASINNVAEFDYGAMSGWLVEVDGVHIDRSAGATKVKPNSQVYWHYTTDYTK